MGTANDDADAHSRTTPAPAGGGRAAEERGEMPPLGAVLAGRFQLEGRLGRGGSGVVYRAFDRVMGEAVAVKILYPERAADDDWVRRLVREVKVARTIVHPNVRRIFEIAQADGYWLITMELGVGSLGERLRAEREGAEAHGGKPALRPWRDRRSDAQAVADGLAAIHSAGITHRDVTPQNVLLMAEGRLVLSDFGLALLDGETTALIAGTPNYVAPEVLLGEKSTQRSDVWQLGVVLHEIFFGVRPQWKHAGERQVLVAPAAPDATTPTAELVELVRACLQVNRERRPASAGVVARQLDILGIPSGKRQVARTFTGSRTSWGKHALRFGLAVLAVVLGVAVAGAYRFYAARGRAAAPTAELRATLPGAMLAPAASSLVPARATLPRPPQVPAPSAEGQGLSGGEPVHVASHPGRPRRRAQRPSEGSPAAETPVARPAEPLPPSAPPPPPAPPATAEPVQL